MRTPSYRESGHRAIRHLSLVAITGVSMEEELDKHERLRKAREAAGYLTAAQAARRFGWKEAAYRHHENGTAGFKPAQAVAYGRAFGVTPEWLLFGQGAAPQPKPSANGVMMPKAIQHQVPVLGEVAAGVWREIAPVDPSEAKEFLPMDLPGYPVGSLYGLKVNGPSMNEYYPDGTYVIVAPVSVTGLHEGDHVIVRRERAGLVETTIKELVPVDGGAALWPRSTDEAFSTPLFIRGDEDDQDAPVIEAIVVASFRPVHRGRQPMWVPSAYR